MNEIEEHLVKLLGRKDYSPSNVPELLNRLGLEPHRQQDLQALLRDLESNGQIARIKGNRYILPSQADLIPGRIRITRSGRGFLLPDDPTIKEISIPEHATSTALHEDHVLVRRDVKSRGLRRGTDETPESGVVIQVLKRHRTQIVGTLQKSSRFLYVIPDDPRMPHDIYVPEPRDVGRPASVGDKVVVELKEWESRNANPEGEIIEVLGAPDEEGVDMLSVLRQYSLPLHFPSQVLEEARANGSEVQETELSEREDCRGHQVVTIDPDDAKDFDDAICLEAISADRWKLWVHIADVSHYVKPGTALDEEARKRGNSTYLVDRVIPMLPEALSNELCSLKPEVIRLTKCVEFLLSKDGEVLKSRFYSAVIRSQRRFAYGEVLTILQRPPVDAIERMLHDANALAQKIRAQRFRAGSLELDFPETKIRLDEKGHVSRIERVENDISHQLIEEYMLLANEAVAARLMSLNLKAIYRVHEEPDEKRLQEYREEVLSHNIPCGNLRQRSEIQKLLHRLGTISIGPALKIGFLKSLMRARYAVEPLGHYGLAKEKYAHFTSPIRRYADLVVHRALFQTTHGSTQSIKEIADHISDTERNSADAERDSKDVKLFAFLKAQLLSEQPVRYPGLVTEVRNFGFFVDVPGLAMSGLVPLSLMQDDFYLFEPQRNHLIGRRSRRIITLGDKVEVQVAKVDSFKKQVDFRLVSTITKAAAAKSRPEKPAPLRPEVRLRKSEKNRSTGNSSKQGRGQKSRPQPGGGKGGSRSSFKKQGETAVRAKPGETRRGKKNSNWKRKENQQSPQPKSGGGGKGPKSSKHVDQRSKGKGPQPILSASSSRPRIQTSRRGPGPGRK